VEQGHQDEQRYSIGIQMARVLMDQWKSQDACQMIYIPGHQSESDRTRVVRPEKVVNDRQDGYENSPRYKTVQNRFALGFHSTKIAITLWRVFHAV